MRWMCHKWMKTQKFQVFSSKNFEHSTKTTVEKGIFRICNLLLPHFIFNNDRCKKMSSLSILSPLRSFFSLYASTPLNICFCNIHQTYIETHFSQQKLSDTSQKRSSPAFILCNLLQHTCCGWPVFPFSSFLRIRRSWSCKRRFCFLRSWKLPIRYLHYKSLCTQAHLFELFIHLCIYFDEVLILCHSYPSVSFNQLWSGDNFNACLKGRSSTLKSPNYGEEIMKSLFHTDSVPSGFFIVR